MREGKCGVRNSEFGIKHARKVRKLLTDMANLLEDGFAPPGASNPEFIEIFKVDARKVLTRYEALRKQEKVAGK